MASTGKSPLAALAEEKGLSTEKLSQALRSQVFRDGKATGEEVFMYAARCKRYGIDPLARELLVWRSNGALIFYLGVDAWARIVNRHPQFDGIEFNYSEEQFESSGGKKAYEWIECIIHRKDRNHSIRVREDFDEVNKGTRPWADMPKRMHRHKVFVQCARLAFGLTDLHSEDDLETVSDVQDASRHSTLTMDADQLRLAVEQMVELVRSGVPPEIAQGQLGQLSESQQAEAQALFAELSSQEPSTPESENSDSE